MQQKPKKIVMFNNYENYYSRYSSYLLTLNAQHNINDVESGFANIETFIMHVYGRNLKHKYSAMYSETNNCIMLSPPLL